MKKDFLKEHNVGKFKPGDLIFDPEFPNTFYIVLNTTKESTPYVGKVYYYTIVRTNYDGEPLKYGDKYNVPAIFVNQRFVLLSKTTAVLFGRNKA